MDRSKILCNTRHLGVPSGVSKMIFEHMVRSTQTMHLSCIKISTISKQTELSYHLSLFTSVYHQVRLKWFLSLWYIERKPCTYLVVKLTLSPNGLKRYSVWHTSSRSSIRCVHSSCVKISPCTYLAVKLTLSPNGLKRYSVWHTSSRSSIRCVHSSCVKISTISERTELSFHLSLFT